MRCQICDKNEATQRGILNREVALLCDVCARTEGLPIVRKPTQEQLTRANQRYSVRERMMKISGMEKLHPVSADHEVAQKHLGKIRVPEKAQESSNLVDNYSWNIKIARRRKKISLKQVFEMTSVPVEVLDSFERGILVKGYEEVAQKLENVLEIKLLKNKSNPIKFTLPQTPQPVKHLKLSEQKEKELLEDFGKPARDKSLEELEIEELKRSIRDQNLRKQRGELKTDDTTLKEKKEITLDDLIKAKKEREAREKKKMMSSEIELEE